LRLAKVLSETPVTVRRCIPRRLRKLGELRDGPVSINELPKEKSGYWTRRSAFVQVKQGPNIQLLPYPLVTATLWLTARRGGLIDSGYLRRGALANAAHRPLLTRE
jgi:hypothetical protein